jgi:histidinol-phosphate aminotransferase
MPAPYSKILAALPAATPFVGPETLERQRGAAYELRLGANESAFGISPKAEALLRTEAGRANWYCDPEHFELRGALAARLGCARENVTIGEGIDGLLGLLVRAFVDPGQAVVTSLGAYPTFNYHVSGYGGRLVQVPYDAAFRNDAEALVETARKEKAKLLYLANPDNPTGTFLDRETIATILARLPGDCLFLLDEAYYEFAPAGELAPLEPEDPRLVRLRTFSKAHGLAGLRVGYLIGARALNEALNRIRLHFGVGRLSQLAAAASLGDEAFVSGVIAQVAEGRRDYEALATRLSLSFIPSLTNFVALDAGSEERSQRMVQLLHDAGVFVRRPGVPRLGRHVRLTVGTAQERAALAERFEEAYRAL